MNAVIFTRGNQSWKIQEQIKQCSEHAHKLNLNVLEVMNCDIPITRNTKAFENFEKILGAYIRHQENGGLDVVIVSRIDRLTRSTREYKLISSTLSGLGVEIQTTGESLGAKI